MDKQGEFYQAMFKAVSQTLENMIFMEAMENIDQEYSLPAEGSIWTSLLIIDPVQGEIVLGMPKEVLEKFTSHIFSMAEEGPTESEQVDILNELLNTIAGLFMTNLLDADQQYKLGLPELGTGEFPSADGDTLVWKLMTSDEDPIEIQVSGPPLIALQNR